MTSHRKILLISFPGQGFINPSLRFALNLLKMGVHVTFSTTISAMKRIGKQTTTTTTHGLTFAPFSDGHDNGRQPTTTLEQFYSDIETNGASAVKEIISSAAAGDQPFDHLVYTMDAIWAATVANAHSLKSSLLWTQSAASYVIYYYYFSSYESLISGINNNNPTFPISLPGLPPLTTPELPCVFLPSRPKEHDFFIPLSKDHIDILKISPRILVNTFNELETESITALVHKVEFLPIGPLVPLDSSEDSFLDTPDTSTTEWLNTKPKSSVVYVSFGSLAELSLDQVEEIAVGLLAVGRPFVWVIRDSEQAGSLSKIDELKKLGLIVVWCSQAAVLSHQAIGCFVTHGGWNSTVEGLVGGVPMVVFPQWSDQGTNAKMIEDVWKTGVRVKKREGGHGVVEGKEIERCVGMVMEDGEMKRNAEKWRDLARKALDKNGSSTINLKSFLDDGYFSKTCANPPSGSTSRGKDAIEGTSTLAPKRHLQASFGLRRGVDGGGTDVEGTCEGEGF